MSNVSYNCEKQKFINEYSELQSTPVYMKGGKLVYHFETLRKMFKEFEEKVGKNNK